MKILIIITLLVLTALFLKYKTITMWVKTGEYHIYHLSDYKVYKDGEQLLTNNNK